ncbi:MFS transporter [Bacillus luteolus]|uniref:MFS transporter n=1 Tax=Litchfieldia luteola TaxID=682179 RepID=A0ABR9QEB0_9BACI|nr:MFS transporter [Cytobacillus luteolus]MBE4906832.1 MFS transporter [Cytobacillus luteolus]MBP1940514.1 MFS family permease [Cytobacillus luteolus]
MKSLYKDSRLHKVLAANILSSIGSGITMVAIPWLLIAEKNGDVLFGYASIAVTVIMLLVTPYIGMMIDRSSRKKLLLVGEIIGFGMVGLFAIWGLVGYSYETWHLLIIFGSSSLYYTLFYPTLFAFNQEIFEKNQYKELNGVMEVQGQLSTVLSGGIASLLVTKIDLKWILLVDSLTFLGAFLLLLSIPYSRAKYEQVSQTFVTKMLGGYHYMRKQPVLFWFLLASFMPFIGIMVTNYVFPIYVEEILKADASVFGAHSMIYGIGAVLAGIFIPILLSKIDTRLSIVLTVTLFTVAMTMFIFFPYIPIFYLLTVFIAFGNAGTRVARNSLMMDSIPNEKIGRVDSLYRVIGYGMRIVLLSVFTSAVSGANVMLPFGLLSVVLIISSLVIILSLKINVHKNDYVKDGAL